MSSSPFTVNANLPASIVIGATGLMGLAQEVRTVITTRKGSVPLDRDFGVEWDVIDSPIGSVLPTYIADVAIQIEKYVPRVEVLSVEYQPTAVSDAAADAADGTLRPVVTVRVRKDLPVGQRPAGRAKE